jgi:hypothetical protein
VAQQHGAWHGRDGDADKVKKPGKILVTISALHNGSAHLVRSGWERGTSMRRVLAIFAVLICLNAVGIAVYVATNSAAVAAH